jgi:3-oxoacyl-[acyl-carrier protein] reductase
MNYVLLYMPKNNMLTLCPAAFTRALTTEFKPRSIRVNALLPGWIESQMWDGKSIPPFALPRHIYRRPSPM